MAILAARRISSGVPVSAKDGAPPIFLGILWFGMIACWTYREAIYD
jgi:hypothetical protein